MHRIVSGFFFSFIFEYVCASCVSEEGGKADKEERRLSFEMQEIHFFYVLMCRPVIGFRFCSMPVCGED
jgi:hypothetical protein